MGLQPGDATPQQKYKREAPGPQTKAISRHPGSCSLSDPSLDQRRQLQDKSKREWKKWGDTTRDKINEGREKGKEEEEQREETLSLQATGLRTSDSWSVQPWGRALRR